MLKRIIANCCLLVSCLLFFSVSCGQEKLPETEIEKIRFAFNGVERSFSVVGKQSASSEECSSLASKTIEQGLTAISQTLAQGQEESDSLDGLEYDQPPMIQFQYLKALFEKAGNQFVSGRKYYHTVTGKAYLDVESGERKTSADGG